MSESPRTLVRPDLRGVPAHVSLIVANEICHTHYVGAAPLANWARAALCLAMACVGVAWPGDDLSPPIGAPPNSEQAPAGVPGSDPPARLGIGFVPGQPLEGPGIAYAIAERDGTTDIATIRVDGSNRFIVVDHPATDTEPVWSPGGTVIAFVSDRSGTPEIYLVDPDGSNLRQVTFGESVWRPRWNPRGQGILYRAHGEALRVVDVATGGVRQLAVSARGFAWSPDGTRVAYTVDVSSGREFSAGAIRIVDEGGAHTAELLRTKELGYPESRSLTTPVWEPDMRVILHGELLGFADPGHVGRGYRMSVQGADLQQNLSNAVPLSMAPDGSRLIYAIPSFAPGFQSVVRLLDMATGEATPFGIWGSSRYDWTADGAAVVYSERGGIFVLDGASGATSEVVRRDGSHPSWRPPPSLLPEPLPVLAIESPDVGEDLSSDTTTVELRIRAKYYDGPWQWSLDAAFGSGGQGGGHQVAGGTVARIGGLRPGAWYTAHIAPVDGTGALLEPVFPVSRTFRVAASEPTSALANTLIAYVDAEDGEIYVTAPDDPVRRRVTTDGAEKRGVSWSPDGTRLAYASSMSGTFDLWTIDSDGGGRARVTRHPSNEVDPAWSPDGTRLAFTLEDDYRRNVYVVALDGSAMAALTTTWDMGYTPSWSPDGSRVAFALADGTGVGIVAPGSLELTTLPDVRSRLVRWSPLGGPLLIVRNVSPRPYDFPRYALHTVDLDGRHALPLPTQIDATGLAWSPDGSMIAIEDPRGGIYWRSPTARTGGRFGAPPRAPANLRGRPCHPHKLTSRSRRQRRGRSRTTLTRSRALPPSLTNSTKQPTCPSPSSRQMGRSCGPWSWAAVSQADTLKRGMGATPPANPWQVACTCGDFWRVRANAPVE